MRAALVGLALLQALAAHAATPAAAPRPDIILISIDTLRADHLNTWGYARDTSPRIAAFARNAIVFEQAWSQSPKTAASHMSLFTGLQPEVHGVGNPGPSREVTRLSDGIPTLTETLRAAGYRTHGVHGGGNVRDAFGFARGFESYVDDPRRSEWPRLAREVVERHGDSGEPLFLFVHTYAVHAPYTPPVAQARRFVDPGYAGRIVASPDPDALGAWHQRSEAFWKNVDPESAADRRHLADLYDAGIAAMDADLGGFLEWLAARESWRRTLLVLLSDHGEEFGEHGEFEHKSLHGEVLHVPLVLRFPDDLPAHRPRHVSQVVRLIDVLPSLLDYLGLPLPSHVEGRSLLPLLRGEPQPEPEVWSQVGARERPGAVRAEALRVGDWKLIRGPRGTRLYRLSDDPGEQRDLASSEPARAAELSARLDALERDAARLRESFAAPQHGVLDPETERQLEALGYLPPPEPAK
jgi:arylsulfatase A-like enzyme